MVEKLINNYDGLKKDFSIFFPQLIQHVNNIAIINQVQL